MITRFLYNALGGKVWIVVGILVAVAILVPASNLLLPFGASAARAQLHGRAAWQVPHLRHARASRSIWCGVMSASCRSATAPSSRWAATTMGMYLMRQIGDRGVYSHPILPDFMVFLNWTELPWYWWGFDQFWFAMLMVMVVPGLLAFVFGWLAFRSRVTGVYLSIITQAMTYALMLAFFRNDMGFGGQ